ncbi:uncharacterized protein LOC113211302 isoform X2 [Frankliniella occidentalis]|uniref:Uncharacterized protein LOC113211302 isoform X2 n=1 Tax=Frankliniella occidentalis TaxID=133901 RepID=A0A6J1SX16_FRAOC|nr:uncharacterized protein LOC113211302 isoform X2 [Frankliniella occidentalis]
MASPDEVSGSALTFEEFDSSRIKVEADTFPEIEENANPSDVSSSESKEGLLTSAQGPSSGFHSKHFSVTVSDGETIFKCKNPSVCCIGTMAKILESNPPPQFITRARLMEDRRYSIRTHIARLRDLLEEYSAMAANRKFSLAQELTFWSY